MLVDEPAEAYSEDEVNNVFRGTPPWEAVGTSLAARNALCLRFRKLTHALARTHDEERLLAVEALRGLAYYKRLLQLCEEAMCGHAASAAAPCDTPDQARAQAVAAAKLWVLENKRLPRLRVLLDRAASLWAHGKEVAGRRRVRLHPIPGVLEALTRAGRVPPQPQPRAAAAAPTARCWDAPGGEDEEGEGEGADGEGGEAEGEAGNTGDDAGDMDDDELAAALG